MNNTMKDYIHKVPFIGTAVYQIIRNTPLHNELAFNIHSVWGTINNDGKTFPPIFPGPQPASIERKNFATLKENQYVVCEKTNGVRYMCACITHEHKNLCVLINRALDMYIVNCNFPKKAYQNGGSLLDGELVQRTSDGKWNFMVYDGMLISGKDIKHLNLVDRIDQSEKLIKSIMKTPTINVYVKLKTFYTLDEFEKLYKQVTFDYDTDGYVFTPVNEPVKVGTHMTMFKWKPLEMNTIDFQVKMRHTGKWGLYIQEKGRLFFQQECEWPNLVEDCIVECSHDSIKGWTPIGFRTDKHHPNNRYTFYRTLKNISEDIQVEEFFKM